MNIILIILVVLEMIFLVLIYLIFIFSNRIKKESSQVLEGSDTEKANTFRESDLKSLPLPVQRYFSFALKDGQKYVNRVKVMQSGYIRVAGSQRWLPLKAVQYFNCSQPAFIWVANVRISPLIWVTARDMYYKHKGGMVIKLFSSIPITNAAGKEMDVSSLIRYLAEMVWFPTTLLPSRYLSWEPIDDNSAQALIDDGVNKARVIFKIDDQGRVTEVYSSERYREKGGRYYKEKWKGYLKNYQQFEGINVPSEIEAEWELTGSNFKYVRIKVEKIEYG